MMKKTAQYLFLFALGGAAYYTLELIFRGFSHPTMFLLGGLCFLICCGIHALIGENTGLAAQMLLCAIAITTMELLFGYILNLKLGMNIWSYADYRLNFKGQICLRFSMIWYLLGGAAIVVNDWVCRRLYGRKHPPYSIMGNREQRVKNG